MRKAIPLLSFPRLTSWRGIITYAVLNGVAWILAKLSGGRIIPHDHDQADYWSARMQDGLLPEWLRRIARGKLDFWRERTFNQDSEGMENNSHDSYGQHNVDLRFPAPAETPRMKTVDFMRTWEMPQLSPPESSISGSASGNLPDRTRLERIRDRS